MTSAAKRSIWSTTRRSAAAEPDLHLVDAHGPVVGDLAAMRSASPARRGLAQVPVAGLADVERPRRWRRTVNSPLRPALGPVARCTVAMASGISVFGVPCGSQPSPRSAGPAEGGRRRAARPRSAGRRPGGAGAAARSVPSPQPNSSDHAGPDAVDGLVGEAAALGEGDAEDVELGLDVAGADAEDDPAARELVEGGERLGRHQRVAVGGDVDVAQQPGAASVMPASQPSVATVSYQTVLMRLGPVGGDGDVVAHGDVDEAGLVGRPGDRRELVAPGGRLPRLGVVGRSATAPAAACRSAPAPPEI